MAYSWDLSVTLIVRAGPGRTLAEEFRLELFHPAAGVADTDLRSTTYLH
jgi:hypothetical protein